MGSWGQALGGLGAGSKVLDWFNQKKAMETQQQYGEAMHQRDMQERMMQMAISGVLMPEMMLEKKTEAQRGIEQMRYDLGVEADKKKIILQKKVEQETLLEAIDRAEESGLMPEGATGVTLQEAAGMMRAGAYKDQVGQMVKESNQRITDAKKEPEGDLKAMKDLISLKQAVLNLEQDTESLDPITKAVVSSILSADKEKAIWDQMEKTEELTPEQQAKEDITRTFNVTAQANTAIAASAIATGDWRKLDKTLKVLPPPFAKQVLDQLSSDQMAAFEEYVGGVSD